MSTEKTREVLLEMLTENVGRSVVDSGGQAKYDAEGKYIGSEQGYGRNFERNSGLTLEALAAMPPSEFHTNHGDGISVTHNVFHWLVDRLEFNENVDKEFNDFAEQHAGETWFRCVDLFMEHLAKHATNEREAPAGLYGEGEPVTINTCNGEDLLSQVIQFTYWTEGEESYVLLSIHGGADVRGGYTRPRAFSVVSDDETSIFDNAKAVVVCDNDECVDQYGQSTRWTTDNGCRWHSEGGSGTVDLDVIPLVYLDDERYKAALAMYKRLLDREEAQGKLFPSAPSARSIVARVAEHHRDALEDDTSDDYKLWDYVAAIAAEAPMTRYDHGHFNCPMCKTGTLKAWFA